MFAHVSRRVGLHITLSSLKICQIHRGHQEDFKKNYGGREL